MSVKEEKKNIITDNMFSIVVFIVGFAIQWGIFTTKVADLEKRLEAQENFREKYVIVLENLSVNTQNIKTSIEEMKLEIKELRHSGVHK